jgi:hypothetical protein
MKGWMILDFGFWILDWGVKQKFDRTLSKIVNLKSKIVRRVQEWSEEWVQELAPELG